MAASSIFFNGRVISVPGSYSEVDPTGLEAVGLGAAGIVAVLGTAEGGIPVSELQTVDDIIRITKPSQRDTFRSGDLREVIDLLFAPANDAEILAGAQEVVCMKVNPATQSTASFSNVQGVAMAVTSEDYGAFTEQINVSIADGTVQGKLVTIIFEDTTESVDDLGGDDMYTLTYDAPAANGWATMTAEVNAGGVVKADGTRSNLGLDSDIVTTLAAPGAIEVVSASAGDTTQTVTVYGLNGSGDPVSETLALTGTVASVGSQVFAAGDVLGAKVAGTTAGIVSVRPSGGGLSVFDIPAGADPVQGMLLGSEMYVAGTTVSLVSSGASVKDVILVGLNASGAASLEKVTLTGTTPVVSVGSYTLITGIVLGDVEAAQTITLSAVAAQTTPSIQNTLQKVADYYNARATATVGGFALVLVTSQTTLSPANLDVSVSAVNCLDPANPGFKADLYAITSWINTNSEFITAAADAGASGGAPSNTAAPVFLSGGVEGTTAFSDYQDALNFLKRIRVNTIVPLTGDPAVHAAVKSHCEYMGGVGRSERDAVCGIQNTALTDVPTKTEYKSQIVDLNTRHIRAVGQAIERFNSAGERTEYQPMFAAAIAAGMQAGSPVGTSLTFKYANVLGFRQDASWSPTDDAEELIQAGACFLENVDGVGRRWVRNVTTHLTSSNIAFTEASVNEATNFSAFNFRTNMEISVGKRGFAGTVTAAQGVAINTLGLLVDEAILVQWRSLDIELVVDVLEVSVEVAPVIPINFVKNTLHLVTVRQSAA